MSEKNEAPKTDPYLNAQEMAAKMTEIVANLREGFTPILEGTIGYRNMLLANGFNPADASRCASDFHAMTASVFLRGAMGQTP